MKKFSNLFAPIQVGNLMLRNRIALAPMSFTVQNFDRGYPQEAIQMIERIAQGGCGLITMGETVVGEGGKSHVDMIMLDEPGIERSLYRMSEACHRHGAAISVEISHGGAFAHKEFNHDQAPMAPSKYSEAPGFSRGNGANVRPMTVEDMDHVADQFAAAVKKVKDYGFDMAQIHMGHGWLLHQFLSPLFNNRTDEYGGSIENRMRFPLMVMKRIREVVGPDFPLDVRISGTEVCDGFLEGGLDTPDVIEVCKAASQYADLISVSCGGIHNFYTVQRMSPSIYMKRGINVYLATAVRDALRAEGIQTPVSTVGGLASPAMMDEIIASGKADICNMARALIADPDLPKKAKEGREEEILHCVRCSMCQHQISRAGERLARCTINPTVGFETDRTNDPAIPALHRKKLVIVGGGPCGIEAALTAAQRGHSVILLEKKDHLGGLLDFADYVPFKEDVKIYRDRQIRRVMDHPSIEVRLNTEATPELVASLAPDACFAAIGAVHKLAHIPGMEKNRVIYADELHGQEDALGEHVVVVGGGLTGAETAIYLADLGKQVTLVGRRNAFASDASQAHCAATNYQISIKTKSYKNTAVTEITEGGVICQDKATGETFSVAADSVVIAIGMLPKSQEAVTFEGEVSEFRFLGDCRKAGTIQNATMQGYYASMDL
jgi:2,4-dienoyl-CoA reductase-like NADH-dependent reductase (Old Yellow Enzyme family)/thioredoxin reductase